MIAFGKVGHTWAQIPHPVHDLLTIGFPFLKFMVPLTGQEFSQELQLASSDEWLIQLV